jgi:hypothetical protein
VPVVVTIGAVNVTAFDAAVLAKTQATLIAPMTPSRKCRDCSLIGFSPFS